MQNSGASIMQRSTKGRLRLKVVFHRWSTSIEGHLPPKVVFHKRSSSTEGCLPPKFVFHLRLSFTYHNSLVDIINVRAVNAPNLSLLPCLEVASPQNVVVQRGSSSTYHDTLVDLIFVRALNILLPCLEVFWIFFGQTSVTLHTNGQSHILRPYAA